MPRTRKQIFYPPPARYPLPASCLPTVNFIWFSSMLPSLCMTRKNKLRNKITELQMIRVFLHGYRSFGLYTDIVDTFISYILTSCNALSWAPRSRTPKKASACATPSSRFCNASTPSSPNTKVNDQMGKHAWKRPISVHLFHPQTGVKP